MHNAIKPKDKNLSRNSTNTNTSKYKKKSTIPKQHNGKTKNSNIKDQNKTLIPKRKAQSRDGFTMTNSVNIPQLSPASHS